MSGLIITTPAVGYPVSRSDALLFLKQNSGTPDDALVDTLIAMATSQVEVITEYQLNTTSYRQYFNGWPTQTIIGSVKSNKVIELLKPPLISVESVKYLDEDNVEQTIASSNYTVANNQFTSSCIVFNHDFVLPRVEQNLVDTVYIDFTCGWEGWNSGVPGVKEEFIMAIKLMVNEIYEHRLFNLEGEMTGTLQENSFAMQILNSLNINSPTGIGLGGAVPNYIV